MAWEDVLVDAQLNSIACKRKALSDDELINVHKKNRQCDEVGDGVEGDMLLLRVGRET